MPAVLPPVVLITHSIYIQAHFIHYTTQPKTHSRRPSIPATNPSPTKHYPSSIPQSTASSHLSPYTPSPLLSSNPAPYTFQTPYHSSILAVFTLSLASFKEVTRDVIHPYIHQLPTHSIDLWRAKTRIRYVGDCCFERLWRWFFMTRGDKEYAE